MPHAKSIKLESLSNPRADYITCKKWSDIVRYFTPVEFNKRRHHDLVCAMQDVSVFAYMNERHL